MNIISGDPVWLTTINLYIDHDIRVVISKEEEENFVNELAESIKRIGLIHWISVVDESSNKEEKYRIVAGRERYKACALLGAETVPCSVLTKEQANNAELIELLENTDRKDFKPLEIILQVDKVHSDGLEKNSMLKHQDTADYLKKSRSFVTRMLKLAILYGKLLIICENINDDNYKEQTQTTKWDYELLREFLWANSMNKIEKAVRDYEQNYIIRTLGQKIQDEVVVTQEERSEINLDLKLEESYKSEALWRTKVISSIQLNYKIGDTFSYLKNMPNKIDDMCFWDIDPPYGIDYETKDKEYKDLKSFEAAIAGYDKIIYEMVRISGDNSKALIWHAAEPKYGNLVQETLTKYGWTFDPLPFIWIKPKGNSRNRSKLLPRCYEQCTLAYAPSASIFGNDLNSNWFECDSTPPDSIRYHPNEKPLDLMHYLYYGFFTFGNLAHWFIPFAGSGKGVYLAAKQDPKYLYAADLSQKYKDQLLLDIQEEII